MGRPEGEYDGLAVKISLRQAMNDERLLFYAVVKSSIVGDETYLSTSSLAVS